jgi:hypothetical protein
MQVLPNKLVIIISPGVYASPRLPKERPLPVSSDLSSWMLEAFPREYTNLVVIDGRNRVNAGQAAQLIQRYVASVGFASRRTLGRGTVLSEKTLPLAGPVRTASLVWGVLKNRVP